MCVCIYTSMHIYIHIHMYIHKYICTCVYKSDAAMTALPALVDDSKLSRRINSMHTYIILNRSVHIHVHIYILVCIE